MRLAAFLVLLASLAAVLVASETATAEVRQPSSKPELPVRVEDSLALIEKLEGFIAEEVAAVESVLALTSQGRPGQAEILLGYRNATGGGVLKDDAEAVRWYRMAAEQGEALGQVLLGRMYATGQGVLEDDAEAVRWYRMAGEREAPGLGDIFGRILLGLGYATGEGVPEDSVLAHMWLNIAGANSFEARGSMFETISSDRALIEATMTADEVASAVDLARTCMASAYRECAR